LRERPEAFGNEILIIDVAIFTKEYSVLSVLIGGDVDDFWRVAASQGDEMIQSSLPQFVTGVENGRCFEANVRRIFSLKASSTIRGPLPYLGPKFGEKLRERLKDRSNCRLYGYRCCA